MRYVILGVRAHYYGDNPAKKQDFVSGEWSFGSLEFVRSKDLKALLTKRYGNESFKFAILDVKSELCPVIPLDGLDNLFPKVRSWVMLSWMKSKVLPKLICLCLRQYYPAVIRIEGDNTTIKKLIIIRRKQ